ncbi:phage terminase large subunit [Candidatus Saccharibacteria bacterium]|nr:phage terminase large subunit [Candidatus Saccharibacteria bacterium]
MYKTTAVDRIRELILEPTFYKVIQGGMRAGKTVAIMIVLVGYAESYANSKITVVGQSYGHLKDGALDDFKKIMRETNRWDDESFNKTELNYEFRNGSVIQFRSIDKMKAHGLARDVLFVNEANAFSYDTFDQLASRTEDFVIIDYNPTSKFWAHEELVEGKHKSRTSFTILTYKDNEALSPQIIENIESHKPKDGEEPSNYWTVYGLGQIGSLEGNIYSGWEETTIDHIRQVGKLVRYGLDFGFSNDETALVAVYELEDGKLGLVEKLYRKGLLGSQYGEVLRNIGIDPNVLIVADSARPEIIAEIQKAGFRCIGADKNPGSVLRGIDRVAQRQIVYAGTNLKREYLSYAWRKKRSGEILDEPEDGNDHALDAVRYAVDDLSRKRFDF